MSSRAILFLQLGGPETLEEVPGFLYRLFSDPDVIRVKPSLLRKAIAASIAIGRKKASRELYALDRRRLPDSPADRGAGGGRRESAARAGKTSSRAPP